MLKMHISPRCGLPSMAGLVLIVSSVFSAQINTLDTLTLQTFLAQHSKSIPTLQQLDKCPSDSFGKGHDSKDVFIRKYQRFLADYAKVSNDYKQYNQVATFTAIRCDDIIIRTASELSISAENRPDNSLYVAFALLTGAGVDYDKIGDRAHLKSLALSYGVTECQIENGIWETLTRDWNEILSRVVDMIGAHADDEIGGNKEPFVLDVLHPYLTFVSRGYSIPDDIERQVYSSFGRAFSSSPNAARFLNTYVSVFKEYVQGASMDSKLDISLNRILQPARYRISVGINRCITYKLLDYRIAIDTLGIGSVLMQKRIGVSLLGSDMGLDVYSDSNVTLTYDYLLDEANDIDIVLNSDSLPKSYHSAANTMWSRIGCCMDITKANGIYRTLIRNGFSGLGKSAILNRLVREIATHELKHKWDELKTPKQQWINVDVEISAHLTEAIYGGNLGYGLISFINRIQTFYSAIEQPSIRNKLKPLIIESWGIAQGLSNRTIKDPISTEKLKAIYGNYRTLDGKELPSLRAYEQTVVKGSLQNIPELKL
jgi:hypothetical protein